jgi:glutaredoxin
LRRDGKSQQWQRYEGRRVRLEVLPLEGETQTFLRSRTSQKHRRLSRNCTVTPPFPFTLLLPFCTLSSPSPCAQSYNCGHSVFTKHLLDTLGEDYDVHDLDLLDDGAEMKVRRFVSSSSFTEFLVARTY